MPFGLDFKSLVVGAILALWVLPMVMGMFHKSSTATKKTG